MLTYKNHALDQFLEDCLQFCKDLVRVGGRSQSEKLKQYNLNEVVKFLLITVKTVLLGNGL